MREDQLTDFLTELDAREKELQAATKNWIPRGGIESERWYWRYVDSNYTALPFAGGFVDQPEWWQSDVDMFDLIAEKHRIPDLRRRAKDQLINLAKTKGSL